MRFRIALFLFPETDSYGKEDGLVVKDLDAEDIVSVSSPLSNFLCGLKQTTNAFVLFFPVSKTMILPAGKTWSGLDPILFSFFFFSSSQICSVLTALIFFGFILIVLWRRCLIELQKNNGTSFRVIFIEFLRKADNPKVLWIIELVPCAEHPWKSWTSRFLEVCASLPSDCTD